MLHAEDFRSDVESLRYVAGYLAWEMKRQGKGTCGILTGTQTLTTAKDSIKLWISQLSKGGLLLPNDEMFSTVNFCEEEFVQYMKTDSMKPDISKRFKGTVMSRFPEFNPVIVSKFFACRLRFESKQSMQRNVLISIQKKQNSYQSHRKQFHQNAKLC